MIGALVLNGELYNGNIEGDYVVCCDGGFDKSNRCDLLVGDFDSISPHEYNGEIIRLDSHKNMTDGEVGLDELISRGYTDVIIYGLSGGRLDHIMYNIGLMARAMRAGVNCRAHCNDFTLYIANSNFILSGSIGNLLSIAPFTDDLHIMYTKGLEYPIDNMYIDKISSRTISNVIVLEQVEIDIATGEALIFVF